MKYKYCLLHFLIFTFIFSFTLSVKALNQIDKYQPTEENRQARKEFTNNRFGIFIHWGIYSMFGQGEWYLSKKNIDRNEYAKAALGFYPSKFNAEEWVKAFKNAGAKYVCFTSRHHDGFSMFKTMQSSYNIVDGTPFKRDILGELATACQKENLNFNVYYSLLDWTRDDYPYGEAGKLCGRNPRGNYNSYLKFMKGQIRELLTNYGKINAIWFDGWWDHKKDSPTFDWHLPEIYTYIHSIQPCCLIGNNHHVTPFSGEDFQMFERDLPGENKSGFSAKTQISKLPLEMCETINNSWGYKIEDTNYKSAKTCIQLLLKAASKNANLLLNIGPLPNGELPEKALENLKEMGQWLKTNGETVYGTTSTGLPAQTWGVTTQKGNRLFIHIFSTDSTFIIKLPVHKKVKDVYLYESKEKLKFKFNYKDGLSFVIPKKKNNIDLIVEARFAIKHTQ